MFQTKNKVKSQISKVKNENKKSKIKPNSKSQILISKQIPNSKFQCSKLIRKGKNLIWFGIWRIGICDLFGI